MNQQKKGFTLIELLCIIVLIAIIAVVAFIVIDKNVKSNKEKMLQKQYETIMLAARNWASDHLLEAPDSGHEAVLTLKTLKMEGYIDLDISDPTTGKCFSNDLGIKISNLGGKYNYDLFDIKTEEDSELCKVSPGASEDEKIVPEFAITVNKTNASYPDSFVYTIRSNVNLEETVTSLSKFDFDYVVLNNYNNVPITNDIMIYQEYDEENSIYVYTKTISLQPASEDGTLQLMIKENAVTIDGNSNEDTYSPIVNAIKSGAKPVVQETKTYGCPHGDCAATDTSYFCVGVTGFEGEGYVNGYNTHFQLIELSVQDSQILHWRVYKKISGNKEYVKNLNEDVNGDTHLWSSPDSSNNHILKFKIQNNEKYYFEVCNNYQCMEDLQVVIAYNDCAPPSSKMSSDNYISTDLNTTLGNLVEDKASTPATGSDRDVPQDSASGLNRIIEPVIFSHLDWPIAGITMGDIKISGLDFNTTLVEAKNKVIDWINKNGVSQDIVPCGNVYLGFRYYDNVRNSIGIKINEPIYYISCGSDYSDYGDYSGVVLELEQCDNICQAKKNSYRYWGMTKMCTSENGQNLCSGDLKAYQEKLHQKNVELFEEIGGYTYDPESGEWRNNETGEPAYTNDTNENFFQPTDGELVGTGTEPSTYDNDSEETNSEPETSTIQGTNSEDGTGETSSEPETSTLPGDTTEPSTGDGYSGGNTTSNESSSPSTY